MRKIKLNKIPKFTSHEEEANFWDTHSFIDFEHELKDVDVVVQLSKPKEETLVLRLQKDVKDHMSRVAKNKGLRLSALARMWIIEKLRVTSMPTSL